MSFFYGNEDAKGRRPLLAFILVTLAVGAGASVFSAANIPTWYAALIHPVLTPPDWVFPPVWTALYVAMAVAAWRVWRVTRLASMEIIAYGVQLILNFAWAAIFFGLHQTHAAYLESLVLDLAVLLVTILFFRRDRLAGFIFLPYLLWTLYISLLSHDLALLNP
jgi:tryptophan-rich sensory protein